MSEQKQRHWCLMAWLILIIIGNSAIALMALFSIYSVKKALQDIPSRALITFITVVVLSIFNLVCATALLKWKKWGFWGLLFSSVVAFVVSISLGNEPSRSLGGFVGIALLYGVLHIGKENKGWPQLD
jgi:uncharacterized SAM-binding protein YcdF (DUF218 family)